MFLFQELLSHSAGREVPPLEQVTWLEEHLKKWPSGLVCSRIKCPHARHEDELGSGDMAFLNS
jgi:hypothetical protein